MVAGCKDLQVQWRRRFRLRTGWSGAEKKAMIAELADESVCPTASRIDRGFSLGPS
jgi:hypothetical protein